MAALSRAGTELIKATRAYAKEDRATTWKLFAWTILAAAACLAIAAYAPLGPFRYVGSVMLGLVNVRIFIFYHDCLHGTVFRKSKLGHAIMYAYGYLILVPHLVWKDSHNYHHNHTSKIVGSSIGSFPLTTVPMYRALSPMKRFGYRASRHWLTILFGYVTLFTFGMCVAPLLRRPKRYWWGVLLAFAVHYGSLAALVVTLGFEPALRLWIVPHAVSFAMGSYLFYAQHTFPGMELKSRHEWDYTGAALHSSSMIDMGPVMHWLTGNIGYHHVHHLNHKIPFYRLEEAMARVPELGSPARTSLHPREVLRCLSLHLWDPKQKRMLTYREVSEQAPRPDGATASRAA